MLNGKNIIVGVTGSIAAYKAAYLVRLLVQSGAEVKVVLTRGALEFITPLTFSTLSKHPVHSDFTENKDNGVWVNHVNLALWADLMIIAPLSANTMSKMAHGQCDSFFMAVYMSTRCPIIVAPAMDHDMFLHGATQDNLLKLSSFGHVLVSPEEGDLASGLIGKGRMAEPENILMAAHEILGGNLPFKGKHVLVTAGPTYEPIDPVRFIGNHSSGKMGFAIAEELAARGAEVTLVCGPVNLRVSDPLIRRVNVTTAQEMHKVCAEVFATCDAAVMAAAVADYRPGQVQSEKIKKKDAEWSLQLTKTTDIAAALGSMKQQNQRLIGFALETERELEHAIAKLASKNMDMIVLNSLNDEGAAFGTDTNKITLIWPGNKTQQFGLKSKAAVARDIVTAIVDLMSS